MAFNLDLGPPGVMEYCLYGRLLGPHRPPDRAALGNRFDPDRPGPFKRKPAHSSGPWGVREYRPLFSFAILIVALIPLTRWIVGTSLGTTAAIVPLSIAAIPFMARLVEGCLNEVDKGMIEAALVMGSTPRQIVAKILVPEALPSLILAATTTVINLIGYSAMAGTMGGGGLGKIAIQYGYQRFNPVLMFVTVIILIILVQAVQILGNAWARHLNRKRGKGFIK